MALSAPSSVTTGGNHNLLKPLNSFRVGLLGLIRRVASGKELLVQLSSCRVGQKRLHRSEDRPPIGTGSRDAARAERLSLIAKAPAERLGALWATAGQE